MDPIDAKNWNDCKEIVKAKNLEINGFANLPEYSTKPLFRGQNDFTWSLSSTLDRVRKNISFKDYYRILSIIKNDISTCTDQDVELPKIDWSKDFPTTDLDLMPPPGYEFMVNIRHNGFPSPLLDWTRSLYVAAFFAFSNFPAPLTSEKVAIFMYFDELESGKRWCSDEKRIFSLGPNITTHKRHFLQQCEYTICVNEIDETFCFVDYTDIAWGRDDQDILIKITLPYDERKIVLQELESMNINAYSLFGSDESLMHTLMVRRFLLD